MMTVVSLQPMKRNLTIERLSKYYRTNRKELVRKYDGKFIVITDGGVQESFDNEPQAYFFGVEKFGLGNFIMQECSSTEKDIPRFYSPVVSFR